MKVAVVGSFVQLSPQWTFHGSMGDFQDACRSIGRSLAKHGHSLYVQFDKPEYADPYVVAGYVSAATAGSCGGRCIIVAPRPGQQAPIQFQSVSQQHPGLIEFPTVNTVKWDSARFQTCADVDLTILIGGTARTELTGFVVLAARKRLLPIASFGGAAEDLLAEVGRGTLHAVPLAPDLASRLCQRWSSLVEADLDSFLARAARPRVAIVHGRNERALSDLNKLVTSLGAEVTIMRDKRRFGATLSEKWEQVADLVDGAIVLATPDDQGGLSGNSAAMRKRARQNVWLEYGWFWGRLRTRKKTLLLCKRVEGGMEMPSDISGLVYEEWKKSPVERATEVQAFLDTL